MAAGLAAGCDGRLLAVRVSGPPDPALPGAAGPAAAARYGSRLEAARAISNPFERDDALACLAEEAAGAAQPDVVQGCLGGLSNPFRRDEAASACTLALAQAGQGHAAVAVARKVSNPFERDEVLKDLAGRR